MAQVSFPGAKSISITFDPRCLWRTAPRAHTRAQALAALLSRRTVTETNCDKLTFYANSTRSTTYGLSSGYSGGPGAWPTAATPLVIESDHYETLWHTDGSNTMWGWKYTAVVTFPTPAAGGDGVLPPAMRDAPVPNTDFAGWAIGVLASAGRCAGLDIALALNNTSRCIRAGRGAGGLRAVHLAAALARQTGLIAASRGGRAALEELLGVVATLVGEKDDAESKSPEKSPFLQVCARMAICIRVCGHMRIRVHRAAAGACGGGHRGRGGQVGA